MDNINTVFEQIRSLEQSLLTRETRSSSELLNQLLADDFLEFGSSGSVYDKQQIIDSLSVESEIEIFMQDFDAKLLSPDLILATYRTINSTDSQLRHTLRSSIWEFSAGRWQMVFHQGTPVHQPNR
ncbi:MAG: DUF4440 domain-containing protein [Chloroflexi bacterium]|nr:DUF4440 domain-containing protein [Chloroflexota bacterium]